MKKIRGLRFALLVGTIIWSCFFIFHFASAALDHLVISQVQIAGTKADDDFIELFNPTESLISLAGLKLVSRSQDSLTDNSIKSWSASATATVPAFGFYLWVNSDADSALLQKADLSTSDYLSADYGMAILSGGGTILDSVAWGNADNGFTKVTNNNPAANEALLRQDLFSESFAAVVPFPASDPRNSLSATVTPPDGYATSTPDGEDQDEQSNHSASSTPDYPTKSFEVEIHRFLPNPAGTDEGNEWVELINNTTTPVLLDGWLLDDDDKGTGATSSDAFALSGVIETGEVKRFILPAAAFALNNSGGDEVNLYFSDGTIADTAPYSAAAYDDGIFEFRDNAWQPPTQSSGGGGGGTGTSTPPPGNQVIVSAVIKISEFLPNPLGTDEGSEWVELYNPGSSKVSLAGWTLDDDSTSSRPGSSAYMLDSSSVVLAKSYLVITIPQGKFALNNSGSDAIRLFKPDNSLAQRVGYSEPLEGKSYGANATGEWAYDFPTPGFANIFNSPLAKFSISELLPNPAEDEDEFVEILNFGNDPASLKGFKLRIGSREKIFGEVLLASSTHFVLYEEDLPIQLRNSGQTVALLDNVGRELSRVVYPKAARGQAYALSGENYFWTEQATPGEANLIVLAASTEKEKSLSAEKGATTKDGEGKEISYAKLYNETKKMNEELIQRLDSLETELALLAENSAAKTSLSAAVLAEADSQAEMDDSKSIKGTPYLLVAILSAAVFALLLKQFFRKKSV